MKPVFLVFEEKISCLSFFLVQLLFSHFCKFDKELREIIVVGQYFEIVCSHYKSHPV